MADAYIYDAVRTPRGRGKPDGSLHEATALHLATTVLKAVRDRNGLDTSLVDDVVLGCVAPVGEQGSDLPRIAVLNADYAETVAGVQINRLLRLGPRSDQHGRRPGHGRTIRIRHRRRRRIDVARADGLGWRRLADRSVDRVQKLFHAAGHRRRSDRDQMGLLAHRCRRLRSRKPEARRRRLGR